MLDGTAERMPLDDGSVNAVLVAQAFHWFDVPAAAVEIHRVLVPGGGLGVVRNEWDESVDVDRGDAGADRRARRPASNATAPTSGGRRSAATGLFSPYQEAMFPNPVRVDVDTLRARVASLSFVALLDDAPRERLLDAVSDLVAERGLVGADGLLDTPYRTHVTWCRRLEACDVGPRASPWPPTARVRRRAALEATPLPDGLVVRHPRALRRALPQRRAPGRWSRGDDLDGAGVAAVAERWLGDLGHRHVVFDDAGAGERAAAELEGAGWERGTDRAHGVRRRAQWRARAIRGPATISETEMEALQLANLRERRSRGRRRQRPGALACWPPSGGCATTTPARCFGAGEPGEGAGLDVHALPRPRRRWPTRGDARPTSGPGWPIASAGWPAPSSRRRSPTRRGWGADLIVVGADADDWPQLMYSGIGL